MLVLLDCNIYANIPFIPPQLKLLWIYMDLHEVSNDVHEDSILQHPCDVGSRLSPLPVSLALCRGQVPLSNPTLQFLWSVGAGWMITFRFFVGQVLVSVGCVWSPCCLRPKGFLVWRCFFFAYTLVLLVAVVAC